MGLWQATFVACLCVRLHSMRAPRCRANATCGVVPVYLCGLASVCLCACAIVCLRPRIGVSACRRVGVSACVCARGCRLAAGGFAGVCAKTAVAPLDRVRILCQTGASQSVCLHPPTRRVSHVSCHSCRACHATDGSSCTFGFPIPCGACDAIACRG